MAAGGGGFQVDNSGTILTLNGVIIGSGGLTKTGAGTLKLGTANTYGGPTVISSGVLNVTAIANGASTSDSIGTSSNAAANLVLDGGTLKFTGTTAGSTDRGFTLTTSGGTLDASGTTAGTFTISGNMAASGTSGGQTLTLTGTGAGVTGQGALGGSLADGTGTNVTSVFKTGTGTWVLSGTGSTYTGTTSIQQGILSVAKIGSVGAGPSSLASPTTVANGTIALANTGTLRYIGAGEAIDRVIDLAGTSGGGTIDNSGGAPW